MPRALPCARPARVVLAGRYARLEPLAASHVAGLFDASSGAGAGARFAYLADDPPRDRNELDLWIERSSAKEDPLFSAVIDLASGRAAGRQALMRIVPEHGVIEIGHILWGLAIARTRVATEALYLAAKYVFEDLGYRRFEWKCNDLNEASRAAALRFGFSYEGLFRQHMVVKGASRDTAWFSMLDREWPALRKEYDRWLQPENFAADGKQKTQLRFRV
ncbi:MAG: GNAT family N-acetyltransferase [Betaproteobacteria bacterium]|nr:GNAT family N-acetyltransferase [Betaproteobacteria bacterium]